MHGFETLHVTAEQEGRVLRLTFDHGKANEMGSQQLGELERLVAYLEGGSPVVALISASEKRSSKGTPIFVAGANVTERGGWTEDQVLAHVSRQRAVLAALRRVPVLHICVVDGVALGWGTEFMLTADWRIAGPSARFGLPETTLGILPGAGGTSELAAQIGLAWTLRLGMTGERIMAETAERIGLVQARCASQEEGLAQARALAQAALKASPTASAAFKQAVLASLGRDAGAREALEAAAYAHCVRSGQAAIGREHFTEILAGQPAPYGARQPLTLLED